MRIEKPVFTFDLLRAAKLSVASLAVLAGLATTGHARDNQAVKEAEAGRDSPMQMLISLEDQKIDVYRGTELLSSSPISSGRQGSSTPTGVFSILEKRRKHFSNIYNNAPMPFMQRLTWSGIALHQGKLPGYPASHGCIRMPRAFAKNLFSMTDRGMHVVVTNAKAIPELIRHEILPQPLSFGTEVASLSEETIAADPALRGSLVTTSIQSDMIATPPVSKNFDKPLRMIVTLQKPESQTHTLQRLLNQMGFKAGYADGVVGRRTRAAISLFQEGADLPVTGKITDGLVREIYAAAGYENPQNATLRIRRKFKDIYQAPVTLVDADKPLGTQVFTALDFEPGSASVEWMAVSAEGEALGTPRDALDRLQIPSKVRRDLSELLTPGSSLIITDRSFARNTGLGTDFVVITR